MQKITKTIVTVGMIMGLLGCGADYEHIWQGIAAGAEEASKTLTKKKPIVLKPNQQGCCSWHGGVCGCEGGRVVCCDGTYSPTCRCH